MSEHPFDLAARETAAMIHVPQPFYNDEHVLMYRGSRAGNLAVCRCGRHYYSKRDLPVACVRGLCK